MQIVPDPKIRANLLELLKAQFCPVPYIGENGPQTAYGEHGVPAGPPHHSDEALTAHAGSRSVSETD